MPTPAPRKYTPTQQKILDLLMSGGEYTLDNIRVVVGDYYTSDDTIRMHISRLNQILPRYLTITGKRYNGQGTRYRMMRSLSRD